MVWPAIEGEPAESLLSHLKRAAAWRSATDITRPSLCPPPRLPPADRQRLDGAAKQRGHYGIGSAGDRPPRHSRQHRGLIGGVGYGLLDARADNQPPHPRQVRGWGG